MTQANTDQLALSAGLTAKTNQLCLGLESGTADILDLVTPTTAELLKWWFGEDIVLASGGLNFHAGQKQVILNAIVLHEVLVEDRKHSKLLDRYRAAACGGIACRWRKTQCWNGNKRAPGWPNCWTMPACDRW